MPKFFPELLVKAKIMDLVLPQVGV